MFGLGFQEIVLIAVVALILLGPKRLPDLMRTMGKYARDFQNAADDVRREITNPIKENIPTVSSTLGLKPDLKKLKTTNMPEINTGNVNNLEKAGVGDGKTIAGAETEAVPVHEPARGEIDTEKTRDGTAVSSSRPDTLLPAQPLQPPVSNELPRIPGDRLAG